MPALDSTGADRIAKFRTLWDSYTGEDCSTVAVLFNLAAQLLEREGYDRYSKDEDDTSAGLTIFEALERVARDHLGTMAQRGLYPHVGLSRIDRDTETLRDELEHRLEGVLMVTGQITSAPRCGTLWSWTRDALHTGPRASAEYRGKDHVVRLLKLAAVMTMAVEAG